MGIGRLASNGVTPPEVESSDANIRYAPPVGPPITQYSNGRSPLFSVAVRNASVADPHNAPIVNRRERMDGIQAAYVRGAETSPTGMVYTAPPSSLYQQTLVQLRAWTNNLKWYIAYPAATVMLGGQHNLGLAERTPQITTRTTGGPGDIRMTPRPAFSRVQQVPRYSTAPKTYDTKGTAN